MAGDASPADLGRRDGASIHRPSNGLGWAARREVLEARGLYDACILGGADRALLCAALGTAETAAQAARMSPRRAGHYLAWADPFFRTVRARVGYVSGRIFHLWHGNLSDRGYGQRHRLLADFDPFTDIALAPQGCWRWSSDKPELHAAVRRYFESRNEDGTALP
jgi:hypothetical protein